MLKMYFNSFLFFKFCVYDGLIYLSEFVSLCVLKLAEWGPFDLLIGGSPCNDLSMVNPLRKGLFGMQLL